MESSELLNQSDNHTPQSSQQGETSEQKKETSHHSSRRKSSPSSRQRKYRKRSVSESPERSPERKSPERKSPENSPSSHRRSRNTDLRGNSIKLHNENTFFLKYSHLFLRVFIFTVFYNVEKNAKIKAIFLQNFEDLEPLFSLKS